MFLSDFSLEPDYHGDTSTNVDKGTTITNEVARIVLLSTFSKALSKQSSILSEIDAHRVSALNDKIEVKSNKDKTFLSSASNAGHFLTKIYSPTYANSEHARVLHSSHDEGGGNE